MLVWDLIFASSLDGQPDVMFHRRYENGQCVEKIMEDHEHIFFNYISAFPNRDIVRIKLVLPQSSQYSFHYVDKAFMEHGFFGILAVSEFHEPNPYDWPMTEQNAHNIFAEYYKRLTKGQFLELTGAEHYLNWIDVRIATFFQVYLKQKEAYYEQEKLRTKENLQTAFRSVSDSFKKGISPTFTSKSISIGADSIYDPSIEWDKIMRFFEIQLVNSYGMPITPIYSSLNGEYERWGTEEDQNAQSLEGMTYSVLKSFVEQQKLTLQNIKCRKPKQKGYEFIIFNNFKMAGQNYLLIMNIDSFSPELDVSLGSLKGDEQMLLDRIAERIPKHADWFDDHGQLVSKKDEVKLEYLILREQQKLFDEAKLD